MGTAYRKQTQMTSSHFGRPNMAMVSVILLLLLLEGMITSWGDPIDPMEPRGSRLKDNSGPNFSHWFSVFHSVGFISIILSTRALLTLVAASGFGAVIFVAAHLVLQEIGRRRLFATIMKEAQDGNSFRIKAFHKLDNPSSEPSQAVQSHVVLRGQLFNKLFQGSEEFASTLQQADAQIERSGDLAQSWQRKLPSEAKQELKARIIRSAVAILPYYETLRRDFEAKHLLYTQRLVSDSLFKELRDEFVSVCNHIKLLIFDGDCLDESWGSDSLIPLAGKIIASNREKQMQAELRRRQAMLRSMCLDIQQQKQKQHESNEAQRSSSKEPKQKDNRNDTTGINF